jgi:hypothetical protein
MKDSTAVHKANIETFVSAEGNRKERALLAMNKEGGQFQC